MITINTSARLNPPRRGEPIDSPAARTSGAIAQCAAVSSDCKLRGPCAPCCGLTRAEMDVADQVLRFSMTDDVLGMDGIGPERHICDTVALEDSDVCAIPFAELQGLAHKSPALQRQLHKTMSREIVREHGRMLLLGSLNAKERLAMFLLDMSQRLAARGYSPSEFNLRMTRDDIGSYLGQKMEAVSRTLSKCQQKGLISVEQKFVRIPDSAGLERVMDRDAN